MTQRIVFSERIRGCQKLNSDYAIRTAEMIKKTQETNFAAYGVLRWTQLWKQKMLNMEEKNKDIQG